MFMFCSDVWPHCALRCWQLIIKFMFCWDVWAHCELKCWQLSHYHVHVLLRCVSTLWAEMLTTVTLSSSSFVEMCEHIVTWDADICHIIMFTFCSDRVSWHIWKGSLWQLWSSPRLQAWHPWGEPEQGVGEGTWSILSQGYFILRLMFLLNLRKLCKKYTSRWQWLDKGSFPILIPCG